MSFDFNEQMKKSIKESMTPNKKDSIARDLTSLKAKILPILLYDEETANKLLEEYDEILKNGDGQGVDVIISKIVDLEIKIAEYENDEGKEKLYKKQSITIVNNLQDLQENCEQMDIQELEDKFLEIRQNMSFKNYTFADRDTIEQYIAIIQSKIIIKKVREGALDLYNEISKEDEERLSIVMNNEIYNLMQSKDINVQNIISEIKYKMIDRTDAIYDPEIWKLLDLAQNNGDRIDSKESQNPEVKNNTYNTLLPEISKKRKGFTFPSFNTIFQKSLKIGNQKMHISSTVKIGEETFKVKDLAKIDMNWLLSKIDRRTLSDRSKLISDSISKRDGINEFYFYNELGRQLYAKKMIARTENYHSTYVNIIEPDGTVLNGGRESARILKRSSSVINYAELIDKILNCDLKQQLLKEIGIFMEKQILRKGGPKDIEELMDKLPIYKNLSKSYEKVREQVKNLESNEIKSERKTCESDKFKNSLKANIEINQNNSELAENIENPNVIEQKDNREGGYIGGE